MNESIIYGLFGGVIGSLYMGWICSSKPPQLAVVDMQALISKRSQQLAKVLEPETLAPKALVPETLVSKTRVPSIQVSSARVSSVREAGDRLKEDLKTFAATHNLILLAKGSVVGGDLPDKTAEILAQIDASLIEDTCIEDTRVEDTHAEEGDGMNGLFG